MNALGLVHGDARLPSYFVESQKKRNSSLGNYFASFLHYWRRIDVNLAKIWQKDVLGYNGHPPSQDVTSIVRVTSACKLFLTSAVR